MADMLASVCCATTNIELFLTVILDLPIRVPVRQGPILQYGMARTAYRFLYSRHLSWKLLQGTRDVNETLGFSQRRDQDRVLARPRPRRF